jgi:hypothetical protein
MRVKVGVAGDNSRHRTYRYYGVAQLKATCRARSIGCQFLIRRPGKLRGKRKWSDPHDQPAPTG